MEEDTKQALLIIEKEIRKLYKKKGLRLDVCLKLFSIESQKLYKEAGCKSFYAYLKQERLAPFSRAYEHYYIGRYWKELQKDLKRIGFTEKDGLNKLKIFPKKYELAKKELLLKHLKEDTFREFKRFVYNLSFKRKSKMTDIGTFVESSVHFIEETKGKNVDKSNLEYLEKYFDYLLEEGYLKKKFHQKVKSSLKEN